MDLKKRTQPDNPEENNLDIDQVEWPPAPAFTSVNSEVPCQDVSSEQVTAYLELHNQSVSRLAKVNKSSKSMLEKRFVRSCQFAVIGDDVFF